MIEVDGWEEESTHPSHDLHELIAWEQEGTIVIDARLRLDHGRSLLARYDDRSLTTAFQPFFGGNTSKESFFDRDGFTVQLIGQSIYDATPLRERLWQREFFFDEVGHGLPVLHERLLDRNDKSTPHCTTVDPVGWLALTPTEMLQACHDANIRPEWGTVCSITSYSDTEKSADIAIDLSFGIQR